MTAATPPDAPAWALPPGPVATDMTRARIALSDAQHAGDTLLAARILYEAARAITAHTTWWNTPRPPLGDPNHNRHHTAAKAAIDAIPDTQTVHPQAA